MNDLLSLKRVGAFKPLLAAYGAVNGGNLFDAVDGGAGSGATARMMLEHLGPAQRVHAFEPFPGNHRFFKPAESRILLYPQALTSSPRKMTFKVPSTVQPDSVWGRAGMVGYSSVGYLAAGAPASDQDLTVNCVAADDVVGPDPNIGFIKLDLQGGELEALKGMERMMAGVHLMWVEFTGQKGLLEYLGDHRFSVYDTEYFLAGEPTLEALRHFEVSNPRVPLSTGKTAWFGFRRRPWVNFEAEFMGAKRDLGLVQTDLVCVNRAYLDEFVGALPHLVTP